MTSSGGCQRHDSVRDGHIYRDGRVANMSNDHGGGGGGGEVVTLNVGGVLVTTTRSTLTSHEDSMLGAMFSGNYVPTAFDAQGHHFIDRDGYMFRHVLNFLRSGRLCLPQGFKDWDLLEAEADFYQIPQLIAAIHGLRKSEKTRQGFYIEILDFEETAYFSRFYSDPPRGIHTELKNGGLVLSGPRNILLTLPVPEKTMKELQSNDAKYRSVNISSNSCSKLGIIHHLQGAGWQLVTTSFANSTDNDGSYMVHKYMWYLPT